jgi:hypothetical protein
MIDASDLPSLDWQNLQQLPTIDGSQDTETGWMTQFSLLSDGSSRETTVMPTLYNIEFPSIFVQAANSIEPVTRQLSVQYAPNSTFVSIQHVPVVAALYEAGTKFTAYVSKYMKDGRSSTLADIQMLQPVASVLCKSISILGVNDTRPIQFPDTYIAGCGGQPRCESALLPPTLNTRWGVTNYTGILRSQLWNQSKESQEGHIIWVDDIQVNNPVAGRALGAIVVQPDLCETGVPRPYLEVSACVVGAIWANATLSVQKDAITFSRKTDSSQGVIRSSITPTTFANLTGWSHPAVKLSKAWAETLTTMSEVENRTVADNLLRWMPVTDNICPRNGSYPEDQELFDFSEFRPFMHEALVASLVANGMSHTNDDIETWSWDGELKRWEFDDDEDKQHSQAKPPGVVLTIHGSLLGFAYNLDGIAIKIALPILILYILYTVPYVLFTLITGRSSRIWGSMSGFTALAVNSIPTEALKDTSAGIERVDTFRHMISVREVATNEQLELVFEKEEATGRAYRRAVFGRRY